MSEPLYYEGKHMYTCQEGVKQEEYSRYVCLLLSLSWCSVNINISDINACDTSPCLNGGTCVDQNGLYECTCTFDFTGSDCEIGIYVLFSNIWHTFVLCDYLQPIHGWYHGRVYTVYIHPTIKSASTSHLMEPTNIGPLCTMYKTMSIYVILLPNFVWSGSIAYRTYTRDFMSCEVQYGYVTIS